MLLCAALQLLAIRFTSKHRHCAQSLLDTADSMGNKKPAFGIRAPSNHVTGAWHFDELERYFLVFKNLTWIMMRFIPLSRLVSQCFTIPFGVYYHNGSALVVQPEKEVRPPCRFFTCLPPPPPHRLFFAAVQCWNLHDASFADVTQHRSAKHCR